MFPTDFNFDDVTVSTTDANSDSVATNTNATLGRSPYFDFDTKKFILKDGINRECTQKESIQQHTRLFINTVKNKYAIYDKNFGVNTDKLVGYRLPRSVIVAEIKRQISEDLIKTCPAIAEITDWSFDGSIGTFYFTEKLVNGESVVISDDV